MPLIARSSRVRWSVPRHRWACSEVIGRRGSTTTEASRQLWVRLGWTRSWESKKISAEFCESRPTSQSGVHCSSGRHHSRGSACTQKRNGRCHAGGVGGGAALATRAVPSWCPALSVACSVGRVAAFGGSSAASSVGLGGGVEAATGVGAAA